IIQTFSPQNETIMQAAEQDYDSFYQSEIELRRLHNTPPFTKIFSVTVSGQVEQKVFQVCLYIHSYFTEMLKNRSDCLIYGPTPLPVVKLNNRYRYRVNLNCVSDKEIRGYISRIITECNTDKRFKDVSVYAECDPAE
ncbi:MAG: primosomal protein N', partial [Oscillospiraceae bacterium]|nr:primosomal protein N' [Oscillospiraceae bacterium]